MSSGKPMRRTGICLTAPAIISSGIDSVMAVLIKPGATQLTVIPCFPTSRQSERVKP